MARKRRVGSAVDSNVLHLRTCLYDRFYRDTSFFSAGRKIREILNCFLSTAYRRTCGPLDESDNVLHTA
jgi:hypothetical protein